MGLIDAVGDRRTYIDANVFIYAVEGLTAFEDVLPAFFEQVARSAVEAVTSELTLSEGLVKPFADGDVERQAAFERAVRTQGGLSVAPVTRAVLVEAARLRAAVTSLKLPDAIHAATALRHGCAVFLTNDRRIKALPGLDVLHLADLA